MGVEEKSTAELLGDLSNELTALIHHEMELAKVELTEKTKRIGAGAGIFGGAAVVGLLAGATLIAAVIAGIATALSVWLSTLIVGAALFVVAGALALSGGNELAKGVPPIPDEAIETSKEDVEWLKIQARSAKP